MRQVVDLFVGTLLLSAVCVFGIARLIGYSPSLQEGAVAFLIPAIIFPLWAIPLTRARQRAERLKRKLDLLAAINRPSDLAGPPENPALAVATLQFERAVQEAQRTAEYA